MSLKSAVYSIYDRILTGRGALATTGGLIATNLAWGFGAAKNGKGNRNGGQPEDAKNTAPGDAVLLAKYEVEDEEFVFEKDSDYLEVGEAFEFTVTGRKDEDEVVAFDVEDPTGVCDIYKLSVKTGEGVFRKSVEDTSGNFDADEFDGSDPVQAVSNVIICARGSTSST